MSEAPEQASANAEMRRYWNEVAGPRWVGRAELQEARNIEVADLVLREAAAVPGERVLDIGCGPGATALPIAATNGAGRLPARNAVWPSAGRVSVGGEIAH